jgi:type IV secretory pathway VirD2 relaxase
MSDDEDFTPKLGRAKGKPGKRATRYAARVLVAARLAGARTGIVRGRFDGSRIGRGASMGRLLSSRDRLSGFRARRAVVKTRLVRLAGKALGAARAHLRYIQRDGVTREGAAGELYGHDADSVDGKQFLERSGSDRHQFRFIISAEDGAEYPDLKPYVRRLMAQAEHDLGTKLDWVAVDHFNTDQPHTHLILRGVDDRGENLIIAREYIAHGFRERAAELVTLDLGPRTDREIESRLRHDVDQERLTAIDRRLIRRMDDVRIVTAADNDSFQQAVAAGRLRKLGTMGLAADLGGGHWRLGEGLEDTLRRMGERGDIVRLMQRELTARRLASERPERVIATQLQQLLVGRVLQRGFSDELRDRHYLMIDGIDGRVHYLEIGRGDATEPLTEGTTVRASPREAMVRPADRTVAEVAAASGGTYSIDLHLRHDAHASQSFAESHVRRLEAMRRAGVGVKRQADGSWHIGADHLDHAAAYETRLQRDRPVAVEVLSVSPVEKLAELHAPTWLDREMASASPAPMRDAGFGAEARNAATARRSWLLEQGLADLDGQGRAVLRPGTLGELEQREVRIAADRIALETGKVFAPVRDGERVEGILVRRIDLNSGRYAVVENRREFALVPWRPMLEAQVGKSVSGVIQSAGVSWRFGRARGGPEIS